MRKGGMRENFEGSEIVKEGRGGVEKQK